MLAPCTFSTRALKVGAALVLNFFQLSRRLCRWIDSWDELIHVMSNNPLQPLQFSRNRTSRTRPRSVKMAQRMQAHNDQAPFQVMNETLLQSTLSKSEFYIANYPRRRQSTLQRSEQSSLFAVHRSYYLVLIEPLGSACTFSTNGSCSADLARNFPASCLLVGPAVGEAPCTFSTTARDGS